MMDRHVARVFTPRNSQKYWL